MNDDVKAIFDLSEELINAQKKDIERLEQIVALQNELIKKLEEKIKTLEQPLATCTVSKYMCAYSNHCAYKVNGSYKYLEGCTFKSVFSWTT